ncbi:MAG: YHYH protein [Chitinophagales bacterium]
MRNLTNTALAALCVISVSCHKDENITDNTSDTVPDVYQKIYGASDLYIDGDYVVIRSTGLPDHKSPYYLGTEWADMYAAYDGGNPDWMQNPNTIAEYSYTFKIPLNPTENTSHPATPLGPIGVSLNGVPFFNQYAGGGDPLTFEVNSFDQYNGHPQMQGAYHYHWEPLWLTENKGEDALLGFLLDGFPVYGPEENGVTITDADLDAYHGHFAATADYPDGIYHYHITAEDPYINGAGYYGFPGTVSY